MGSREGHEVQVFVSIFFSWDLCERYAFFNILWFSNFVKGMMISLHLYFLTWLKVGLIFDNANESNLVFTLPCPVILGTNVPNGGDYNTLGL